VEPCLEGFMAQMRSEALRQWASHRHKRILIAVSFGDSLVMAMIRTAGAPISTCTHLPQSHTSRLTLRFCQLREVLSPSPRPAKPMVNGGVKSQAILRSSSLHNGRQIHNAYEWSDCFT
jgi:hypothetical protein